MWRRSVDATPNGDAPIANRRKRGDSDWGGGAESPSINSIGHRPMKITPSYSSG
ncbi:MAG: hypothetical protein FWF09_04545 [Bacteroidales bacterium]|nr:hypothetical protein [Bacteroidales bacterium]